jgi:hypothetical protein
LQFPTLSNSRFSALDFQTFPRLDTLENLSLSGKQIDDDCAARLADLRPPVLRSLNLERTSITDSGMRRLCDVYNLDFLNLYLSRGISEKAVPELARMNRLHLLGIGGTGIAPNFFPTAGVKELQRLLPKCSVDCGD